jgi:NAD(P) transhydrogenase subunit alpha
MLFPFINVLLAATADGPLTDVFRQLESTMQRLESLPADADVAAVMSAMTIGLGAEDPASRFIRLLTVFLLAMWVGFEVITKVPQRLHTPLTSGSNAISGITAVGALVVAGALSTGVSTLLGFLAVVLAMINVVGGFVVTHRMLEMFNPKKK